MRQRLTAQWVFRQDLGAILHLGDVMLININGMLKNRARCARYMRLNVHRIHVVVFGKREGKTADGSRTVLEGKIVAERFFFERDVHLSLPWPARFHADASDCRRPRPSFTKSA